jgi:hypothetical protein
VDAVENGDTAVGLLLPREQRQARKRNKTVDFSAVSRVTKKAFICDLGHIAMGSAGVV